MLKRPGEPLGVDITAAFDLRRLLLRCRLLQRLPPPQVEVGGEASCGTDGPALAQALNYPAVDLKRGYRGNNRALPNVLSFKYKETTEECYVLLFSSPFSSLP